MASKLMHRGPYEAMDELENSLLQSFSSLQSQLTPPYQIVTQSPLQLAQLNQAILYGILTQPEVSQSLITHLAAVTNDGYASFVFITLRLVNESYPRLLDQPRAQLLWLLRQLIGLFASEVESLSLSLLRCIVGGDLSQDNVWLAAQLLDILRSNWTWLTGTPGLLTNALFTYLRLLPDHFMAKNPTLIELRQSEIAFCVQILRDYFHDCLVIGRDLVRLLQDVACISEFESIWRDLLSNPAAFKTPAFSDVAQLYVVRTPTRYLTSRITPEMETQIRFMLTHVRLGSQRRYQTWFAHRFLSTLESETLVCDLIRFICCVHHPSNHILQSDIVPRWAIVGWLLKCCKSNHVEANAKLALFYDWIFFMSKTDNIMNIEPALLLMVHSIPKYMDITHSLLEFLFLLMEHYDSSRKDLIHHGVATSVDILVGKGVVHSLEPLSASNHVMPWLREKLITYFPTYCQSHSFDVAKAGKYEMLQQGSYSTSPHPTAVKSSAPASSSLSGMPLKTELSVGADSSVGGNSVQLAEPVGIAHSESKTSDSLVDAITCKRRRFDMTTLDSLVEALNRSQDVAISALENLLVSFLSTSDYDTDENNKDLTKKAALSDSMTNYPSGNGGNFACQITDVLKGGGYDLFSPLSRHPANVPEGDEIMSLTSVILRLYVELHHPKLLQMLLFWYHQGLAVGARLLCYVCRLAEDQRQLSLSESSSCASKGRCSLSEVITGPMVKQDVETMLDTFRSRGDNLDGGNFMNCNAQMILQKKAEVGGTSAFLWHKKGGTNGLQGVWKAGWPRDSEAGSDMEICCTSTVTNAFAAYEEFLKQARKKTLPAFQNTIFSENHTAQIIRLSNGITKAEDEDAEYEEMELTLLGDLEICLAWNVHRLLMVFPWVFGYLSKLSTGKEEIIRLLVSVLDPMERLKFELKLSLKEISVLGVQPSCVARLIKSSLQWDCLEQQSFWRLLVTELQCLTAPFVIELLKCCIAFLNPLLHYEAISGLLLYLKLQRPTVQLVYSMVSLPQEYGRLASAVLASWVSLDMVTVFGSLKNLAEQDLKNGQEKSEGLEHKSLVLKNLNFSVVSDLCRFLDSHVDDKMKGEADQIKCTLLELTRIPGSKATTFLLGMGGTLKGS